MASFGLQPNTPYIQRFTRKRNELPKIAENKVVTFMRGVGCQELVHRISRMEVLMMRELLEIVINYANNDEVVNVNVDKHKGKQKAVTK